MAKRYTSEYHKRYRTLAISCKAKDLLEEIANFYENTTCHTFNRSKYIEKMLEEKAAVIREAK